MKEALWSQLEQIFTEASSIPPGLRSVFLEKACGSNEGLRSEVDALLASYEDGDSFLEEPVFDDGLKLLSIRQQKLSQIVIGAVALPIEQRQSYVLEAGGEDLERLSEAMSLLRNYEDGETAYPGSQSAAASGRAVLRDDYRGHSLAQYRILSVLGSGGMGDVYLALDMALNRKVAVKLLPPAVRLDKERVRRFLLEARAASHISHPNLAQIHECREVGGKPFIVMEFVEGQTLRELLSEKRIDLKHALQIVIQVSAALDAAHKAGVIHRDIKPENIMVRSDGVVKVLDFSLAKLTERAASSQGEPLLASLMTEPGRVMGTAAYMSPEQVRGESDIDLRTDVWSLGVLLYEMLEGKPPFTGATNADVMASVLTREAPKLSFIPPNLEPLLNRVKERALSRDRSDRYPSVVEMHADLLLLQASEMSTDYTSHINRRQQAVKGVIPVLLSLCTPGRLTQYRASAQTGIATLMRRPLLSVMSMVAAFSLGLVLYGGLEILSVRTIHYAPPKAVEQYKQGETLLAMGDAIRALVPLEQAVQLDPDYAVALARLAQAHSSLGYGKEADRSIRRLNVLTRGFDRYGGAFLSADRKQLLTLEDELVCRAATESVNGHLTAAIETTNRLLQRKPDDLITSLELARLYERTADYTNAIATYDRVIKSNSGLTIARLGMANAFSGMHRSDDAFRELNASIDEFKAQRNWEWLANALNQRGLFLADLGRIAEAESDFHEAIDISIKSQSSAPQIQALIYTAYILPSNEGNAGNIAAEALSVAKRDHRTDVAFRAQLNVGEYFLRRDDLERASKNFDLIRFSQPSLTRVLMRAALHLAEIALKRRDREAAQRSIITAGSLDGSQYQDLPELNSLLRSLDRGDFDPASSWINQQLTRTAFEDSGAVRE